MEGGAVLTDGLKQTCMDQYYPASSARQDAAREKIAALKAQAHELQVVNKSTAAALAATKAALAATTAALAALDDEEYISQSALAAIAAENGQGHLTTREPEELKGDLELLLVVLADKIETHHDKAARRAGARKELASAVGTQTAAREAALHHARDNISELQSSNSFMWFLVLVLLALAGSGYGMGLEEGERKERLRTASYTVHPQPHFTKDSTVPESAGNVLPQLIAGCVNNTSYAEFSLLGHSTSTCDDHPQSQHGDVLESALAPQGDHASRIYEAAADKTTADKADAVDKRVGDKSAADKAVPNAKTVEPPRAAPPPAAQTAAPHAATPSRAPTVAPGASRPSRSEDGADSSRATNGTERVCAADKAVADAKVVEAPRAAPPFATRTAAPHAPHASAPRRAPTAAPGSSPTAAPRAAPPSAARTTASHTGAPGGVPTAAPSSSRPTPAPTRRPHQPATAPSTPWPTCEPLPSFEVRVHWVAAQGNKLADLASKSAPD